MEIKYSESAYNPFPWQMRGNCYEFDENNKRRFIEIYYISFDTNLLERFSKEELLEDFSLRMYIELVGFENINKNTHFIYELITYIGDPDTKNESDFLKSIKKYKTIGFTSINNLLEFCQEKWGIKAEDFVPLSETNIKR